MLSDWCVGLLEFAGLFSFTALVLILFLEFVESGWCGVSFVLGAGHRPGSGFWAGVVVWAVGQLASGATLLCRGSVPPGVTMGGVSLTETCCAGFWSGGTDSLGVLFGLGLLRCVLLQLRASGTTMACPKAILGLVSPGSRPLPSLWSATKYCRSLSLPFCGPGHSAIELVPACVVVMTGLLRRVLKSSTADSWFCFKTVSVVGLVPVPVARGSESAYISVLLLGACGIGGTPTGSSGLVLSCSILAVGVLVGVSL